MKKMILLGAILGFFLASNTYAETIAIGSAYKGTPDVDALISTENDYNNQKIAENFGLIGMLISKNKITQKNDKISLQIKDYLIKNNPQYLKDWAELSQQSLNHETNLFSVSSTRKNDNFHFVINESIAIKKHYLEDKKIKVLFLTYVSLIDSNTQKEIFSSTFEYNKITKIDVNDFLEDEQFLLDSRHQSLVNISNSLYFQLRKSNALYYMGGAHSKNNPFIDHKGLIKKSSSYFSLQLFTPKDWKIKTLSKFNHIGFPKQHKNYLVLKTDVLPDYWLPEKPIEQQRILQQNEILNYIASQLTGEWIHQEEGCSQTTAKEFSSFCFINTAKTSKQIYYIASINGFMLAHRIESSGNYDMLLKYYEKDIMSYINKSIFKTK